METRFFLKKTNNKQTSFIYFTFSSVNGETFRFSTKVSILNSQWSAGYPKKVAITKGLREILAGYKSNIDEFIRETIGTNERQPTKYELAEFVKVQLDGEKTENNETIADYVKEYLVDDSIIIAEGTMRLKKTHLNHFVKAVGKNKKLADLNKTLLVGYKKKLKNEKIRDVATTNNYLKNVKAFLSWLATKDYIEVDLKKHIKRDSEIVKDVIALTESEFKIIESANLKEIHLQKQIDIFLFGCYTSLSIIDIKKVKKVMIDRDNCLQIRRTKNHANQKIPLLPQAIAILEKYGYKLPLISNNKGSENLKKAFRKLELTRMVRITKQRTDGKVIDEYLELCEVISWHKSRKTAITTLLAKGVNVSVVMQISGHIKPTTMNRYISFSNTDLIDAMNKMRS
jgi:integrase